MPTYKGSAVAKALFRLRKEALSPLLDIYSVNGKYEGCTLLPENFTASYFWFSQPVGVKKWKRQGTMTRPCRMVHTSKVLKVSFQVLHGGKKMQFVWFRERGLAVDEIEIWKICEHEL